MNSETKSTFSEIAGKTPKPEPMPRTGSVPEPSVMPKTGKTPRPLPVPAKEKSSGIRKI
ncbi:MAG: hypothetical protein II713_01615 [Clostridia bacterium]|nr:hypothetical protein [Clostridia bacterium]